MTQLQITSLGSSFAAGPGIPPTLNPQTGTSGNNYPHLLAKALNSRLHDVSASGATLLNILTDRQQVVLHGTSLPPQIDGIPKGTDIVTITAGGNDMGYSRDMIADAGRATIEDRDYLSAFLEMLGVPSNPPPTTTAVADASPDDVKHRFITLIDALRETCGHGVRIYLVEYLDVFGAASALGPDQPLSQDRVDHYISLAQSLKTAYAEAAAARQESWTGKGGVEVVSLGQGHEVGSREPWVSGFRTEMMGRGEVPFHPNGKGHEAVAKEVERRIKGLF